MSFSSDIKKVICKTGYECPGCKRAELAGFFVFPSRLTEREMTVSCSISESARRIADSLYNELGEECGCDGRRLRLSDRTVIKIKNSLSDGDVINPCCVTAYIRGAFLATGSVTDPEREYHLEFSTYSVEEAQFLMELLSSQGLNPRGARRRNKKVIYLKECEQIADLIGYMSDGKAGLEIISAQIEKEMKSSAQRRVNCDSANLTKQARASAKQLSAIKRIKKARKWSRLPEVLREMGELRLANPDLSIEELGRLTDPPIGKSGVNHRLKRIMEYANKIEQYPQ